MSLTIDRGGADTRADEELRRRHGGPVVLATFESAPFEPAAARLAVEAAAEMRAPLLIAQVLESRRGRRGGRTGEALAPALADTVRAAQAHAAEFAVETEALRLSGRHPVASLSRFVADRRAALVVLATDPAALRRFRRPTRRRHRNLVAALSRRCACLIWTAQAPDAAGALAASRSQRRSTRRRDSPQWALLRASMSGGQFVAEGRPA
jgi:hypothetical protein